MDLKQRSEGINAVKWALIDKFGAQIILLVNMLVLARLLQPEDFGLIAILYIFLAIASAFVDSGMGGGLIRKQYLQQKDLSTFFYFNIVMALIFYAIMYISAPYIADFYGNQKLIILSRLLSLNIIINGIGIVHKVILVKALSFKKVTRASLIASVFSTIIGILCAFNGFGIWTLLIIQICQAFLNTLLLVLFTKWWPKFEFSIDSFKEMFSFGFSLLLTALLNIGFANIYQPLIGKYYSLMYAGFYFQAKKLYEIPILSISQVVDSVTYPLLVKFQNNQQELANNYRKVITLLIFVTLPLIFMLSLLSEELVYILLGKQWGFAAELLSILAFSGIFRILETSSSSLLKIEGRTKLILKLELFKKAVILLSILGFYSFGIKALMFGIVLNSFISFLVNQYFTSVKINNYKRLGLILFNSVLTGSIIWIIKVNIQNPYISIVLGSTAGIALYLLLGYIQKLPEQMKLVQLLLKRKSILSTTS